MVKETLPLLVDTEGCIFVKNTGVQLEGDSDSRSFADSAFLTSKINAELVTQVQKRFSHYSLQQCVTEAIKSNIWESSEVPTEIIYDDDAWMALSDIYASGKYKECHLLADALNEIAESLMESMEILLFETFNHTMHLKDQRAKIECAIITYLELYMGCLSTNPRIEFIMPEKGTEMDEFKMSPHELGRSDADAVVLFPVKFGIINGQNVIIKPLVMCM